MGCILSCITKQTKSELPEIKSYIECSICLESLNETSEALACGHVFHSKCLKAWKMSKQSLSHNCPLCLT